MTEVFVQRADLETVLKMATELEHRWVVEVDAMRRLWEALGAPADEAAQRSVDGCDDLEDDDLEELT